MNQKAIALTVAGVGVLILVIGALMFAAQAERANVRPVSSLPSGVPSAVPVSDRETGPATACFQDSDCWCRIFTGAEFLPGRAPSNCQADNRCAQCFYE